jgi:hypothetical protein
MIYILTAFFVLFVILVAIGYKRLLKHQKLFRIEVRERLEEIEKYAYTDIRELIEFLDKVKVDYAKRKKN